jgi:hypothetical protein
MKKATHTPKKSLAVVEHYEFILEGISSRFNNEQVTLTLKDKSNKEVVLHLSKNYHFKADGDKLLVTRGSAYPIKYWLRLVNGSFEVNPAGEGIGIGDIRDVGLEEHKKATFDLTVSKLDLYWNKKGTTKGYLQMRRLNGKKHEPILE